ncbi:MAG: phosphate propanoyltransferase [Fusobacteria bacterium]|nr:phosphate propanoyltransferase [Fusobacteriota bacterium]
MSTKIIVEASARHIHVTQETLEELFGKGHTLTIKKELSQPGQYACEEKITAVGPRGRLEKISILGPVRAANQLEVSLTDARVLGVEGVIRESGDIKGTPGIQIFNGDKCVTLSEGVIVAKRHVHLDPATAAEYNVKDKEVVMTKIDTADRALIFDDVMIRVSPSFKPAMHVDIDEANACAYQNGSVISKIIKR